MSPTECHGYTSMVERLSTPRLSVLTLVHYFCVHRQGSVFLPLQVTMPTSLALAAAIQALLENHLPVSFLGAALLSSQAPRPEALASWTFSLQLYSAALRVHARCAGREQVWAVRLHIIVLAS